MARRPRSTSSTAVGAEVRAALIADAMLKHRSFGRHIADYDYDAPTPFTEHAAELADGRILVSEGVLACAVGNVGGPLAGVFDVCSDRVFMVTADDQFRLATDDEIETAFSE